ncbi:MAG: Gfo/Idh/MocA family oxidoreductase [Nitrospirota bacterium]
MSNRGFALDGESPKVKIRVGVIGVGYLGQHHARIYSELSSGAPKKSQDFLGYPDVHFVGVADIDFRRAEDIAEKYGVSAFKDYHGIMDKVDAVSIAVPTSLHHAVASEFIDEGIDILIEKPITTMLNEADDLIMRAEKKGVILQVGHSERFNPAVSVLSDIIDAPFFVDSQRLAPFVERGTDVDVTVDLMIHDIDIILSLVNSNVKEVRACGSSVLTPLLDLANARLVFENGCIANITVSRVSPEKVREIRFFQSNACISLNYQTLEIAISRNTISDGGKPYQITETIKVNKKEPLREEITAFIQSVSNRTKPAVSGIDGREALRIALIVSEIAKRNPQ